MEPLKVEHLGTLDNPVKVWSLVRRRCLCLCTRFPADEWTGHGEDRRMHGISRRLGMSSFLGVYDHILRVQQHDTLWFKVHKDRPARCTECGCVYALDYEGEEEHGEHHH
jgi:hypothetical protein